MPTVLHETLIDLFRQRPQLAAELLGFALDTPLPEFDHARLESGDFPEVDPTEYRADAVVVLTIGTTPVLAVVIEVQLRHDKGKRWSWPVYLTTLHARLRCPTVLLVMCPNEHTATRCRTPITVAPEFTLKPIALGPIDVPVVTDPHTATTNPELSVLSAIAHRHHPDREKILATLAENVTGSPNGRMYIDLVTAILPKAARHILEALMTTGYEYKSELARTYYSEGKATGEADALLVFLEARGLPISAETRARITECDDVALLRTWVERAAHVSAAEAVFE